MVILIWLSVCRIFLTNPNISASLHAPWQSLLCPRAEAQTHRESFNDGTFCAARVHGDFLKPRGLLVETTSCLITHVWAFCFPGMCQTWKLECLPCIPQGPNIPEHTVPITYAPSSAPRLELSYISNGFKIRPARQGGVAVASRQKQLIMAPARVSMSMHINTPC